MNFDIYCDESQPDVFWSKSPKKAGYLLIGGLWIPTELRTQVKTDIRELRSRHGVQHEIKWHKVHRSKEAFYLELIDLFFEYGAMVRFRCIAVEGDKVDMVRFHGDDSELGFYKFYYQLIKHWIEDYNNYSIFCDARTSRRPDRLKVLRRTLDCSNLASVVKSVQAVPSGEVALIQFADFLVGVASAKMNQTLEKASFKAHLVQYLEARLGHELLPTARTEQKFNVFKIDLQGGW